MLINFCIQFSYVFHINMMICYSVLRVLVGHLSCWNASFINDSKKTGSLRKKTTIFLIFLFRHILDKIFLILRFVYQFVGQNKFLRQFILRERPFDFQGGGGGLVRLEYLFYMFSVTEFFFSTIEGWTFFVLQCMMREVILFIVPFVWIIICIKSVICLEKTTIHGGSVLVLLALIVLKHLHQGCGTPKDHHTTCSQART